MVPLHMGGLHPYEQALTLLLAFGPFLVLGLVIWLRRREESEGPDDEGGSAEQSPTLPNGTQPEPPENLPTVR